MSAGVGAVPRFRLGQVRIKQALVFWALGIVGTLVGSRLATVIPEVVILTGFAAVMLAAAVALWRKSRGGQAEPRTERPGWLLPVVALGVGLLTGVFGVGGGFLVVPALVLVFGLPFAVAAGTSLMVVALNSLTALAFKWDTVAQVDWRIPLLVIVGGVIAATVASRLNTGIPQALLERAFAVLLVLLSAWMVIEVTVLSRFV